jgi:hypothetical protein
MRLHMSDFQLLFLRDAARLVDSRLRELDIVAKRSDDALAESLYDTAEYMTCFGLVACQQFVFYCIAQSHVSNKEALGLGPRHRCGESMVGLINSLANRWKHDAGWGKRLNPLETKTLATLSRFGLKRDDPYFTSNALAILLPLHRPRIQRVLPILRQWNQVLGSAA